MSRGIAVVRYTATAREQHFLPLLPILLLLLLLGVPFQSSSFVHNLRFVWYLLAGWP